MKNLLIRLSLGLIIFIGLSNLILAQGSDASQKVLEAQKQDRSRFRTGVLTSSILGTSGGFSVIDAETLYRGNYLFGGGIITFGRPGRTRISQFSINGAFGITERFEFFYSLKFGEYVSVRSPQQLSGLILLNALKQSTTNRGNGYLDSRRNSFFPLPGLNVSGALNGGILPGINQNNGQTITDPLTGLPKIAFPLPSFINESPFLSESGWSAGDLTIGGKFRLGGIKEKNAKNGTNSKNQADSTNGEGDSMLFSNAIFGYVKIPFNQSNGIFNSGPNNSLFKSGSSGTFDFGIFYATSNYVPFPIFGKKKRIKLPLNADCPPLRNALNQAATKTAETIDNADDDEETVLDYYTLNIHTNWGYIRNGDFSVNNIKTLDRRDSLVFAYGTDTMLNSHFQAIAELRYEQMIGRGTQNLTNYNPLDLTFGTKFYPKGVPGLKEVLGDKTRSKNFFSINFAYRLSLNQGNTFSRIGSSKHNFSLQFNFGNTRLRGKNDTTITILDEACLKGTRAELEGLEIDKNHASVGETVTVTPIYKSGEYSNKLRYWFVDGVAVEGAKDEDGDETGELKYKITLKPRSEPYKIRFIAQTKFTQLGETINFSGRCPCDEKTVDLYVEEPTISVSLVGSTRVSAQREQTTELTAAIQPNDNETIKLRWNTPPEVRLDGENNDRNRRAVTPANLPSGEIYRVSVTANDKTQSDTVELKVNFPPTIKLKAANPNQDLQGVALGDTINLLAEANDRDNDKVNCNWILSGMPQNGSPFERTIAESTTCENYLLVTNELELGSYQVWVMATDAIGDIGQSEKLSFEVVRRAARIYFKFDRFDLLSSEKKKLDEEAKWLNGDLNRQIRIRVEGYADPRGSSDYNFKLGCRRACRAKYYLVKEKGINPDRIVITTVSYGENYATGINETTWKDDRRVDLIYTRFSGEVPIKPGERTCNDCSKLFQVRKTKTKNIKSKNNRKK